MRHQEILDQLPDEIKAATPTRLVVLYYDGAIAALRQAHAAIEKGDIETRFNAVATATELVFQLYMALDRDNGGDIADNLARIYNFVLARLPRINIDNDALLATRRIGLLEPLQAAWSGVDRQVAAGTAPGVPSGPTFAALVAGMGAEAAHADAA